VGTVINMSTHDIAVKDIVLSGLDIIITELKNNIINVEKLNTDNAYKNILNELVSIQDHCEYLQDVF